MIVWTKTLFVLELLDEYLAKVAAKESQVGEKETNLERDWTLLIPPAFSILKKMSDSDVLESSYRLNMTLTVLLKLLNLAPDNKVEKLDKKVLEPEILTYCIRRCCNPETRQTALKVLARCALPIPEYVLQNSMTIFTFMGSHLLKIDSKQSYKIACDALDVIVPAIKTTCKTPTDLRKTSLEILNNFIHMEDDVPEHRYPEFIFRLIRSLGTEKYLWIVMLLCVKSTFKAKHRAHKTEIIYSRLSNLVSRFSVPEVVTGFIGVFVNIRGDAPMLRRIFNCSDHRKDDKTDEWDVLRLGGLLMLNNLMANSKLHARIGTHPKEETKDLLQMLLQASIETVESFQSLPETLPNKLKTSILHQGEKTIELVLSLLPYHMYISIVNDLLRSTNNHLRKRAMEVVTTKLDEVESSKHDELATLMPNLLRLAVTEADSQNKQVALLSIRKISLKMEEPGQLSGVLATLNTEYLQSLTDPAVIGAALLTITDVLVTSDVSGVPYLNKCIEWMLKTLGSLEKLNWNEKNLRVVYSSLLLGLQKVVSKFGGFLHPFLEQLVSISCTLQAHPLAQLRAKKLWSTLAEELSPHTMLPRSRDLLLNLWNEPSAVAKFTGLVALNAKRLERHQLTSLTKQLVDLFALALTFRVKNKHLPQTDLNETESEIISSFISVTLRLGLEDFRPAFLQLTAKLNMAVDTSATAAAARITLFNVLGRVAGTLKNLFSFGVSQVISECIQVITARKQKPSTAVLEQLLSCLGNVLLYNKVNDISLEEYEKLVAALLSIYQVAESLHSNVEDTLLALAEATDDDASWKQLNFASLMMMRDPDSTIRKRMLILTSRFVTSRKDTYMALLPDAVPFLSEALEDDDQEVEKECRELIKHMETTFGENIGDYFS